MGKYRYLCLGGVIGLGLTFVVALIGLFRWAPEPAQAASYSPSSRDIILKQEALLQSTQVITVTNVNDSSNGDTSSISNLLASPGLDGVSYREALQACNNTPGEKLLTFAPSLSGTTIHIIANNGGWDVITGGDLTILGDLDQDGTPDITLDGSLGTPNSPTSVGIAIWSSNISIEGIRITNFAGPLGSAVPGSYTGTEYTVSDIRVVNNVISGTSTGGIGFGPLGFLDSPDPGLISNLTWQNIEILSNTVTAKETVFLYAGSAGSQNNRILNLTIRGNTLYSGMIGVLAGDDSAPPNYSDYNQVRKVVIEDNTIINPVYSGIVVVAGNLGNRFNTISDVRIVNNIVVSPQQGILLAGGGGNAPGMRPASDNVLEHVLVDSNKIVGSDTDGIFLIGGEGGFYDVGYLGTLSNTVRHITITNNLVQQPQMLGQAGISLIGGMLRWEGEASYNRIEDVTIAFNQIYTAENEAQAGISIMGGVVQFGGTGSAVHNILESIKVYENQLVEFPTGIRVVGGQGYSATDNLISGTQYANTYQDVAQTNFVTDDNGGAERNTILGSWYDLPVVVAGPDQVVAEAETVWFNARIYDLDEMTDQMRWLFGDGDSASNINNPSHPYADNGIFSTTFIYTDVQRRIVSDSLLVTVTNISPEVSVDHPLDDVELGKAITIALWIQDPGQDVFTATISWGDSVTEKLSELNRDEYIYAAHIYTAAGNFPLNVSVDDDDGGYDTYSTVITVTDINAPPVITGQVPLTVTAGKALEINLAHLMVSDLDNVYPTDFTLEVGDGNRYTRQGNIITPSSEYTGPLIVPVRVKDDTDYSGWFDLGVNVIQADFFVYLPSLKR